MLTFCSNYAKNRRLLSVCEKPNGLQYHTTDPLYPLLLEKKERKKKEEGGITFHCIFRNTTNIKCGSSALKQSLKQACTGWWSWQLRLASVQWLSHGLTFSDVVIYCSFDLGEAPLHIIAPTTGPCTQHDPKIGHTTIKERQLYTR